MLIFNVNGDTFILRRITCDSATESFDVKTEAVEPEKKQFSSALEGKTLLLCRRSLQKPFTSRNVKRETNYLNGYEDHMATIRLGINKDFYLL